MTSYRSHLRSSDDLVTSYEATRAGFVALALEKNRKAMPYLAEARALQLLASSAKTPLDLLHIQGIEFGLLAAAGLSEKSLKYLASEHKQQAIRNLIEKFLAPAGVNFVEELVFRFLLTRGEALGGAMRNIGGFLAQRKLTRALIATLSVQGVRYRWQDARTGTWIDMTSDDADVELSVRALSWNRGSINRTLIYNLKVPLVRSNVDLCLFSLSPEELETVGCTIPETYLALGELKGGIDPAGADEHWKTARTSLSRIRDAFASAGVVPQIFFIGASIERRMAKEIWQQLEAGLLSNAANLTDDHQLMSVSAWLCSL